MVGVHSGTTTLVDQGGPSCMTLPGFRKFVVEPAATRVDAMASRMDSLALVLTRVADKLDTGSGTAAKLVNDKKLYDETQATMQEIRALVHDLRTNPNKYFKVSVF